MKILIMVVLIFGLNLSADEAIKACGHISHTDSNRAVLSEDDSYYFMRVDCDYDGFSDPKNTVRFLNEALKPQHKGRITHFSRLNVLKTKSRNSLPYVCFTGAGDMDPCGRKLERGQTYKPVVISSVRKEDNKDFGFHGSEKEVIKFINKLTKK